LLDTLITSRTRIRLLVKFFTNQAIRAHLRGLAEEYGESTHAIRLELNRLSEAGFLEAQPQGNTIQYQANSRHPMFASLRNLVAQYLGFDQIIESVLQRLGNLRQALVVGDYAQGIDSGTIDLLLVGQLDIHYLNRLIPKAEELIGRKIRYQVQSAALSDPVESNQPCVVLWNEG
jgi:hypothetical protein